MYTDEQLAQHIAQGQSYMLGEIIDRYEAKLRRYIIRMIGQSTDIDDILQEVFIKCFTHIQSFDTTKKFSPWIYRIAHNEAINKVKKRKTVPFSELDTPEYEFGSNISGELDTDREVIRHQDRLQLREVLAELPDAHREILVLYFYEELSYAEISDILRIPVSSVGVKISRAKDLLRKKTEHLYQ